MDRQVLKLNRPSSTAESAPSDGVDYYSDEDEEVTKQRAEVLDELVKRPLVYIANELARLRRENARLMEENAVKERHELNEGRRQLREDERRIREEREEHERTKSEFMLVETTLRKERDAMKRAVRYFVEQTGYVSPSHRSEPLNAGMLPHEILVPILRATQAPRYQLEPSVIQGRNNAWLAELRLRKGLRLVCRWWSGPATELLFEDIVLRRMGQIFALAAVLQSQKPLARLVKSIRLDTCVVLGHCYEAAREALQTIFSLCTALRTFEYRPAEHFPTTIALLPVSSSMFGAFNPAWFVDDSDVPFQVAFQERVSSLTVLDLAMPLSYKRLARLHLLLSVSTRLNTLKLRTIQNTQGDGDALNSLPALQLPHLHQLQIPVDDTLFLVHVSTTWGMPALQRLTTLNTGSVPEVLLAAHGSNLLYLNLYPKHVPGPAHTWSLHTDMDVARVTELCPAVEHLVAQCWDAWSGPVRPKLESQTLRYLDVWVSSEVISNCHCRPTEDAIGVRHLYGLARYHVVDLPVVCDPRIHMGDDDVRVVHVSGYRFVWTRHKITHDVHKFTADCPPLAYDDESVDDSGEYIEDSDTESEDSDGLGSSSSRETPDAVGSEGSVHADGGEGSESEARYDDNDSDSSSDEGVSEHESDYWQPDERIDRDTILHMFRANRTHNE